MLNYIYSWGGWFGTLKVRIYFCIIQMRYAWLFRYLKVMFDAKLVF